MNKYDFYNFQPDYCTYMYIFPQGTCDEIDQRQGMAELGSLTYNRKCGPLSTTPVVIIVCFCNEDHCNSEKELQAQEHD
ncbi:hypothetical protein Y032_0453g1716 [Ancylostoma ceylanicum]|uniref:Uncharacterized protein n=1 Tax=Ancylostoma ceylanicum TaxID=53326 RepID=A0A016X0C0_9BILA|nr:hypothetical protein Y032_0453g1716 [Ancylostoma ceylanicum]